MANTKIYAAGVGQDIGCRVVTWNEDPYYSFYKSGELYKRDLSLEQLRKQISCFVLHHGVTWNAKHTYDVLNSRGYSANFIINDSVNDDGCSTLFQCADIKDACKTHYPYNVYGPGVEISYMPQYWENPHLYSEYYQKEHGVPKHKVVLDTIHGCRYQAFAPTDAQIEACARLIWGFGKLFPDIKMQFPRKNGKIYKGKMKDPHKFKGLISHFNITTNKIDPLAYPFEHVEKRIQELDKENKKREVNYNLISKLINFFKK